MPGLAGDTNGQPSRPPPAHEQLAKARPAIGASGPAQRSRQAGRRGARPTSPKAAGHGGRMRMLGFGSPLGMGILALLVAMPLDWVLEATGLLPGSPAGQAAAYWGLLVLAGVIIQLVRPLVPLTALGGLAWWGWFGLIMAHDAGLIARPFNAPVPPQATAPAAGTGEAALAAARAAGGVTVGRDGRGGAIYLAAPPNGAYGMSLGMADRLAAHGQAELGCQAGGGGRSCRVALAFAERCAAIAHARRNAGLVRTAHPGTFTVSFATAGAGDLVEAAERQALDACRPRDRTARCEVVASRCAP